MASYPITNILSISGTECIGDSRVKINSNFESLSASANFACMAVTELSGKWTTYTDYSSNPLGGYIKLASGIVFQWGRVGAIATNGSTYVQFPIPFDHAVFNINTSHVISTVNMDGNESAPCSIRSDYNQVGFTLIQDTVGANAVNEMWMAIGF